MLFEESDLLKALPEQFFAGLVAKVNAILLSRCVFQRKILLAISIHSFEAIVPLKKQLLVFTKNIMGSIWMQSVRFVSWVELKLD